MFFILTLAKQGMAYDHATRSGDWAFRTKMAGTDLSGKTLLLVGFGRVGRALASRAAVFGMRVTVYDPMTFSVRPTQKDRKRVKPPSSTPFRLGAPEASQPTFRRIDRSPAPPLQSVPHHSRRRR
jgi:hypothetical protein